MNINFCGAVKDTAGYGEFSRYFIAALSTIKDIKLSVEPILLYPEKIDFGTNGKLANELSKVKPQKIDVNIINMIPSLFPRFKKSGVKNIGFTMFETDRLPKNWANQCNMLDAIFVPSKDNKEVFINSGVKVPIYVIPCGIKDNVSDKDLSTSDYTFYYIFQWIERKNPEALIRAYTSQFTGKTDVKLILKTYKTPGIDNSNIIKTEVNNIINKINLPNIPKIEVITGFLSDDEMQNLHLKSHCYVSPHRGEAWGMGLQEAIRHGNYAIATNYGGNTEFMNNITSDLISYQNSPVYDTNSFTPFYDSSMNWADVDISKLKSAMYNAYSNKEETHKKALLAKQFIEKNFTIDISANTCYEACKKVLQ